MSPRNSQHYLQKKNKRGRKPWIPDLKEWTDVCKIYPYDQDIIKHFDTNKETFYVFLDKQRCIQDKGEKSEYLDAYKNGRNNTKKFVISKLLEAIKRDDIAAIIFGAKTIGGILETRDIKHIELKKIEVAFKTKQFMTELASKFNLNYEQLDEFANKFFRDSKLDDI